MNLDRLLHISTLILLTLSICVKGNLLEGLGHLLGLGSTNSNEARPMRSITIPAGTDPATTSEMHVVITLEATSADHPFIESSEITQGFPTETPSADRQSSSANDKAPSNAASGTQAFATEMGSLPIISSASDEWQSASRSDPEPLSMSTKTTTTTRWQELSIEATMSQLDEKSGDFDDQNSESSSSQKPILRAPHPYAPPNGSSNAKPLSADICISLLICLLSSLFIIHKA